MSFANILDLPVQHFRTGSGSCFKSYVSHVSKTRFCFRWREQQNNYVIQNHVPDSPKRNVPLVCPGLCGVWSMTSKKLPWKKNQFYRKLTFANIERMYNLIKQCIIFTCKSIICTIIDILSWFQIFCVIHVALIFKNSHL
jgi:hypothetical protein